MKTILNIISVILCVISVLLILIVASAYEDHVRCLNGYTEVCIPQDFDK